MKIITLWVCVALITGGLGFNAYMAHRDSQVYKNNFEQVAIAENKPATIEVATDAGGRVSYTKCQAGFCTNAPSLSDLEDSGPRPGASGGVPGVDLQAIQQATKAAENAAK